MEKFYILLMEKGLQKDNFDKGFILFKTKVRT